MQMNARLGGGWYREAFPGAVPASLSAPPIASSKIFCTEAAKGASDQYHLALYCCTERFREPEPCEPVLLAMSLE